MRLAASLEDWGTFAEITTASYVSMGFPEHVTRALMSSPERMRRPVWDCSLVSDDVGDAAIGLLEQ